MIVPVLLFILGLILLIKGGDWFVDGATGIAHKFNVPELIIGATVVSIGTTLPEVMVSATSAISGHGEIAYGNAIGSIICNTALIAALTIAIRPSSVDKKSLKMPVIFFFTSAALYCINAYFFGHFSRIMGIIMLAICALYLYLTVKNGINNNELTTEGGTDSTEESSNSTLKDVILLVVGAALIAVGADLLVDNGTEIARFLGVPESVIALTFVALGTSLPELVTAITSLAKGYGALSLGNVIGANIFNLVLVSGVSTVLAPFDVPSSKLLLGHNASLVLDIPLMILVMAILTLPPFKTGKLKRGTGIILLLIYATFITFQFFG